MIIVSPKWIYLNNSKLEMDKSILIDGPIIIDILDNETIQKKYKEISRIEYPNHVLMPTFTESYLNSNNCQTKKDVESKIKSLLKNGVTRLCVHGNNYKDIMNIDIAELDIAHIIELDGKTINQADIKNMTNVLDFYKSDSSKQFCISLNNIIDFDKKTIIKLMSILNEIDMNLYIKGSCLQNISDKEKINDLISFWSEINLIDNSYLHGFLGLNNYWKSNLQKRNIIVMISYEELLSVDNIMKFLYLHQNKMKCLLVTETFNSYDFYGIIKLIEKLDINQNNIFDKDKIINCVTDNASSLFPNLISTGSIKKGNKASFNLFNYTSNQLLENKDCIPKLSILDKQSLTHVWSAGELYKV
tara:strand:- start:1514 stop:2590 length:1077 start_codon:yes stop_codon:yes gene_type:complete